MMVRATGSTIMRFFGTHRWIRNMVVTLLVLVLIVGAFRVFYPPMLRWYLGDKTAKPTYPNQDRLSDAEFETLARQLEQARTELMVADMTTDEKNPLYRTEKERLLANLPSTRREAHYSHIDYFRKAGIRTYEGSRTCLKCHETMSVRHPDGTTETVNTMDDVMNSVHYRLFSRRKDGFTTVGYDGRLVNAGNYTIPVGKIDRACGIPGSFTWTGWAALIEAKPENGEPEMRSEGCGQCHIGGGYGPPSEEMMPIVFRNRNSKDGIDCLICHSQTYDMNQRFVIDDGVGQRWNQDRSMKAAMTAGKPTQDGCLHCHQHNLGGDSYPFNDAAHHLGYKHARMLHEGAKRGTPYTPDADVHAAAGMTCLDCHVSVGHKIARGSKGVDVVSNDLPGVDVSCVKCHTDAPHVANPELRAILNGHTARIACETCHITELQKDNLVFVDWLEPEWNAEEGVYLPKYVFQTGEMQEAVEYLWYNGKGTFLANAIGANPRGNGDYNPLMAQLGSYDKVDGLQLGGIDGADFIDQLDTAMLEKRAEMIRKGIMPQAEKGVSKIYPFKLFNARMYEDMNNQGPFGAMILPFDYKTYYETGDSYASMVKATENPIIRRMYQAPFKYYMMDEFMRYFGVPEWSTKYPLDKENREAIQGHWMRQMGTLMINHAIKRDGRSCEECHTPKNGLLDFRRLGYSEQRVHDLENLPELKMLQKAGVSMPSAAQTKPKIKQNERAELAADKSRRNTETQN